ncbi:unnamed protein product [Durusdinium trenchii]|uniref:Uncharacterized protein n=1 Tax=Durusdinium trenchii TaxID=1381693 RepID=A0ABP0INL2_9DINO
MDLLRSEVTALVQHEHELHEQREQRERIPHAHRMLHDAATASTALALPWTESGSETARPVESRSRRWNRSSRSSGSSEMDERRMEKEHQPSWKGSSSGWEEAPSSSHNDPWNGSKSWDGSKRWDEQSPGV